MITLTPISASASSSSTSEPVCYLLELDEARILLDMGQRDFRASQEQSDWEYEDKVRELAPTLSLVLLSHSPLNYLSLYPYARAHWGLKCPVYATQPTVEMGRVVCLAESESWRSEHQVDIAEPTPAEAENTISKKGKEPLRGPFVPTLEEIHEAFDHIKAIRYNQPLHLGGDLSHVLLTPFPSGHTLGGSLFKLRSPTSGTILYAVGMNHTAERHIDGMVGGAGNVGYDEGVLRPDLLVVEAGRTNIVNVKRRDREAALLDIITRTLENHYSVLLPCDPSPRLLELLVLLDQHWSYKITDNQNAREQGREQWIYPLCLVSRTAHDMVSFARSFIEWTGGVVRDAAAGLDEELTKKRRRNVTGDSYGALDFKHVKFFATPTDLMQAFPLNRPKLVLAIPPSMSHGPSRWLFTAMAGNEGNVILLTSRGEDGTLARKLFDDWQSFQQEDRKYGTGKVGAIGKIEQQIDVEMNSKVPLHGLELEEHLEAERLQKERQAAQQAALDRSRRMLEADDLDSDSDSDEDDDLAATDNLLAIGNDAPGGENEIQMSFDIFVKGQQMRVTRGKEDQGGRFRMFPYMERRGKKVDAYGETLDVGQWVRKGKEIEEEGETKEDSDAKKRKEDESKDTLTAPEVPSKYVTDTSVVDIRASVLHVDMDGLHDGQAIKTIISDLQPRQLILIRSSQEATQALTSFLSSSSGPRDVYAPATGESIRIGEEIQSFSFALGDSMTSGLSAKMSKFEGYEVAMVEGKIAFQMGSTVPTLERAELVLPRKAEEVEVKSEPFDSSSEVEPTPAETAQSAEDNKVEVQASVVPEPSGEGVDKAENDTIQPIDTAEPAEPLSTTSEEPTPPAKRQRIRTPASRSVHPLPSSLFIGDLRLTVLRTRLQALTPPMPAEFAGSGILVCGPGVLALANPEEKGTVVKAGSIVAVRKGDQGVEIEGSVGSVYDLVKKEVYGSFAQVSAA